MDNPPITKSKEYMRTMLVRRQARIFAEDVKNSNMACKIPDEVIDWLKDNEFEPFKVFCMQFNIVQRPDLLWERRKGY